MLSDLSVISAMAMAAAMIAADMGFSSMFVIVVFAMHIRIESKIAGKESVYCLISVAADTSVKLDSVFCQRCLRAAADAAANEYVCFYCGEYAGKRAVSEAIGADKL